MAMGAVDGSASIQVAVRVRPFTIREAAQLTKCDDGPIFLGDGSLAAAPTPKFGSKGLRPVIKVVDDKCLCVDICAYGLDARHADFSLTCSVFDPPEDNPVQKFTRTFMPTGKRVKDQTFGFDRVFDENATQADVYEATTRSLLDSVLDGYNATVFAYGATGCGKTHTITGTAQHPGIIFMTMQELFEKVDELRETKASEITLSYLEIYNETIRDLLSPCGNTKQGLMLREDSHQAVSVAGLSSHKPQNVQEVMDMVLQGNAMRTQSPTEANATSSRSHAVLQVNISLKDRDASVSEPVTMATLSIIDLAGSERASATKNRGERLLEGANINKSLLALGSCINALCDPRKKNHVPYRNSKLTRLLKFSLGGNCRTVMIVCVSPSSQHFDETQNTLRYANRAKNIQTKSVRNVYNVDRHVKDYLKKIDEQMARINELTAQQKQYEELAFAKFKKAESKRVEAAHDGVRRIRVAYDHSLDSRKERINDMRRLRQVERRIAAISGWVGAFDQVCEMREEEEASASLTAMRKTAQGILIELEGSRQHFHQRLSRNNWVRAVETALQDSIRQLHTLDGATPGSIEEISLQKEVELLKAKADHEAHVAILEQEKTGEGALMHILLSAHFETVAILNEILHMNEEQAVQAAREVLGKILRSCVEATGQVIKPDGGLQIIDPVPPTRSGTPRKRKQLPLTGPSPIKLKIDSVLISPALQVAPHLSSEGDPPSPARVNSPRRRMKMGGIRRGFGLHASPKKTPVKKRAVRWRDDAEDGGSLVEFQPTPKQLSSSPVEEEQNTDTIEFPTMTSLPASTAGDTDSSPLDPPSLSSNEPRRPANGRFAAGFLSKRADGSPIPPPPALSLGMSSSDDETSPLRELSRNAGAPRSKLSHVERAGTPEQSKENEPEDTASTASHSDSERSFTADRDTAAKIRTAIKRRSSTGGRRDSLHRRRSPSASGATTSSSPPSHDGIFSASHARRMVRASISHEDPLRSVLAPRSTPVTKGTAPAAIRRSMLDVSSVTSTPASAAPRDRHVRMSSLGGRPSSSAAKAIWR